MQFWAQRLGGSRRSTVGDASGLNIAPLTAAAFFVVLFATSLYPLFSHTFVSINDLANHLTRVWVNLHYQDVAGLQTYFVPYWHFQPDLALDVGAGILARFMPVDLAGKMFLALNFGLILSGTVLLHRATFGTWSLWPFLAALLLYNRNLLGGHINFLFGVGLCLHAVAVWIRLRQHPPLYRVLALTIFATVIYFSHLFALGLLGLILTGYELQRSWSERTGLQRAAVQMSYVILPFIPALLIFIFLTYHSTASFAIEYRSLITRITAFGVPFLYSHRVDGLTVLAVGALFLIVVASGSLRIDWGLAAGASLLLAAQLVMPNVVLTATSVDHRIPIAVILLLIAGTDVASASRALKLGFAVMILALVPLRVWTVTQRWTQDDVVYTQALAGLATVPPNSVVASAFPREAFDNIADTAIAVYYLPVWDVIHRGGLAGPLFAYPTQHPLRLRQDYVTLSEGLSRALWQMFVADPAAPPGTDIALPLRTALQLCQYVAFVDNKPFAVHRSDLLAEVYSNTYIKIYQVQHDRL